jgi:murein DD-endopeptidase MepM/ murein hydrolase activator NlpD
MLLQSRRVNYKNMRKNNVLILAYSIFPRSLRRRTVIALTALGVFVSVAATGTAPSPQPAMPDIATVVDGLSLAPRELNSSDTDIYVHEERVERGDTIAALLSRAGVDPRETAQLNTEHGNSKAFRLLRPGMTVQTRTTEYGSLLNLRFVSGRDTALGFERDGERFRMFDQNVAQTRQIAMRTGLVRSSLFQATDEAQVPDSVATQIAEIFGGDIDFSRDLRRGDRFAVVYEMFLDQGAPLRPGRVLAVEFVNSKKTHTAVWFDDQNGSAYYAPDGSSLRKAFLRSPLEFSRITSGFSARLHPIFREWRFHRGVDYAAPSGTRVRATGDAVVEMAGQQSGYGNLVVLRHRNGITTHYAHLSAFAAGVRKGARVTQGETIGFVGATGWATGPHLHYEFRVHDAHQNPETIAMPNAEPIAAQHMAAFRDATQPLARRLALLQNVSVAALQ